jgi:hypothetical protein
MKRRLSLRSWLGTAVFTAILLLICTPVYSQWVKVPARSIPRGADGKPNLSAPAPRAPDGHPDLSGIWEPNGNKYAVNLAADLKSEDIPYQPWARALAAERAEGSHEEEDPTANCLPPGVPHINASPPPWRLVQTPGYVVVLHELSNLWRQIFLDGREMTDDFTPTWMGYSTGRWDGDTLVVDTRGFNGKAWLDQLGKPTTDALHVIERFHRKDFGHLDIEITIDDPKAYTKPWKVTEVVHLLTDTELMEFICNENNVDLRHLPGDRIK